MNRKLPDLRYLNECLDYDPVTGILLWRRRPLEHFKGHRAVREVIRWNGRFAGTVAGCVKLSTGYVELRIDNVTYKGHRVIYKMMTGEDPENDIDHINGATGDNRWCNIRAATTSQNCCNTRVSKSSLTGVKGVKIVRGKFRAGITLAGVSRHLGYFNNLEDARKAYADAAEELHGEFKNVG